MLENVAAVVLDGFTPFELGVVCEVFGTDRTADGLPGYDFAVVAAEPGPLRGGGLHSGHGVRHRPPAARRLDRGAGQRR